MSPNTTDGGQAHLVATSLSKPSGANVKEPAQVFVKTLNTYRIGENGDVTDPTESETQLQPGLSNNNSAEQFPDESGVPAVGTQSKSVEPAIRKPSVYPNAIFKETDPGSDGKRRCTSEVLSVIAKMFYDPFAYPCPVGVSMMPMGTEKLKNMLEADFVQYSPVLWADPLVPYSLMAGNVEYSINTFPFVDVDVNLSRASIGASMKLSIYGLKINKIINADISQPGAISSIMSVPGLKELPPIATILHLTDHTSSGMLDEAAIVRLYMLQSITVDPWIQVFSSSSPYLYAVNAVPERKSCKLDWTPALDTSDNLQIGTATNTSTLFFRTLDEYASIITGNCQDSMRFKKGDTFIECYEVVYIPVKSCWRGQSWLMPYILSFTTTAWWNHAVKISVDHNALISKQKKDASSLLKSSYIPKAATVYIPGSYTYICLVVVDSSSTIFPSTQTYNVCLGIEATRAGNAEFSKLANAYLGRATVTGCKQYCSEDVVQAINHMSELMATRQEYRRLHLRASVLATSRYNGFGVYPNLDLPPVVPGDSETQRQHLAGVYKFNDTKYHSIGDLVLPDLLATNQNTQEHIIGNRMHWRTDPLGYFSYGSVDISKDATHTPAMWKYTAGCLQYQLTEAQPNVRILRACGVYVRDPESKRQMFMKPVDVFNTTMAYGSLLLGLTNWAVMEMGITMFEHNRMGKRQTCIDPNYLRLWPSLTQNFVVESSINEGRSVDAANMHSLMGMSMNLAVMTKNITIAWYDTHYSWNVPFWFVSAVAKKFGHSFTVRGKTAADFDNMIGYLVNNDSSRKCELSLLTSSTQYERKTCRNKPAFFDILTPCSNGRNEGYNNLSYNMNALIDAYKLHQRLNTPVVIGDLDGVCELNVVVFPIMRTDVMKTWPRAIVSDANRVDPRDESTYPHVSGGLQYPRFT